jgi:tetratricopeptide (TPR) repeat protein
MVHVERRISECTPRSFMGYGALMYRIAALSLVVVAAGCRSSSATDAGPSVIPPTPTTLAEIDAAQAIRQEGNAPLATAKLLEAATHAQDAKDLAGQAWALHLAGDTLLDVDRCGPSRARYLEAMTLHQQLGDRVKIGLTANQLGLWARRCELDEAIGWFSIAMTFRREDPKSFAISANNLAATLWNLNRPDEAQLAWDEALAAAERSADLVMQRTVLASLSLLWVLRAEGRYDDDPLQREYSLDELLARAESADGGSDAVDTETLLEELDRRRERFDDAQTGKKPIAEGSPALARARSYFRRALDAAAGAGEAPSVVCSSFGTFDDRCELLTPKTP